MRFVAAVEDSVVDLGADQRNEQPVGHHRQPLRPRQVRQQPVGGVGRYDPDKKTWTHYPMPQSKSGTYSVDRKSVV